MVESDDVRVHVCGVCFVAVHSLVLPLFWRLEGPVAVALSFALNDYVKKEMQRRFGGVDDADESGWGFVVRVLCKV